MSSEIRRIDRIQHIRRSPWLTRWLDRHLEEMEALEPLYRRAGEPLPPSAVDEPGSKEPEDEMVFSDEDVAPAPIVVAPAVAATPTPPPVAPRAFAFGRPRR